MPAYEYFQAIRNSVGPRTARGQERREVEALVRGWRAKSVQRNELDTDREAMRRRLEVEWRPGSLTEFFLLDQWLDTMLELREIGEAHDAAVINAMERAGPGATRGQAIAAELAAEKSALGAIQKYRRNLVRQQRQLMRDLRALQEHRALADEEQDWREPQPYRPAKPAAVAGTQEAAAVPKEKEPEKVDQDAAAGRAEREPESREAAGNPPVMPPAVVSERKKQKTNPILSQAVEATGVGLQWPTGAMPPMRLASGEMFDEWNRPDRR